MKEADQPLSPKIEEFLKNVTRDFGKKPSVLSETVQKTVEKQQELREINQLPEPERTFRLMAFNQTNFTFAHGVPNLKKFTSEGVIAVVRDPFLLQGYRLGYHEESPSMRQALNVPDYKDIFYQAKIEGLDITPSPTIFESEPENIVSKLFVAVLTDDEKMFLTVNTG